MPNYKLVCGDKRKIEGELRPAPGEAHWKPILMNVLLNPKEQDGMSFAVIFEQVTKD